MVMLFFRLAATRAIVVILSLILAVLANLVLHPAFTSLISAKYADSVSTLLPDIGMGRGITKADDVVNQGGSVTIKFVAVSNTPLSSSSLQSGNDKLQGTLIVKTKVINSSAEAKKPSDFILTIHGNDPSPSSFLGNSSGTHVKLHMGMYSTSVSGPSGYNSTFSGDCSGGMMAVETKECTITNSVHSNSVTNNSRQ
jgi:hypothetical protein